MYNVHCSMQDQIKLNLNRDEVMSLGSSVVATVTALGTFLDAADGDQPDEQSIEVAQHHLSVLSGVLVQLASLLEGLSSGSSKH